MSFFPLKIHSTYSEPAPFWSGPAVFFSGAAIQKPSKRIKVQDALTLDKSDLRRLSKQIVSDHPYRQGVPAIQQLTQRSIAFLLALKQAQSSPKTTPPGVPSLYQKHLLLPSAPVFNGLVMAQSSQAAP